MLFFCDFLFMTKVDRRKLKKKVCIIIYDLSDIACCVVTYRMRRNILEY